MAFLPPGTGANRSGLPRPSRGWLFPWLGRCATAAVARFRDWFRNFGSPLGQVARRATAQGETIHNEPFEVTSDMVADAVLAADALGRFWKKRSRDCQ